MKIKRADLMDRLGFVFIFSSAILASIAILGIWEILADEVVKKSVQTLGLLAGVAAIIAVSGRFYGTSQKDVERRADSVHAYAVIRRITLIITATTATLLALVGVLSIWEVISEQDILSKSISSIGVLAFTSLVIVILCMEREGWEPFNNKNKVFSGGGVIIIGTLLLFLFLLAVK